MTLSLGFSPCPNDTFIFDALIHHKIDTEGLTFDVFFDDVETLNTKAFAGTPDITKLSFHAYAYAAADYVLLDAGSALGSGVGPLLISQRPLTELTGSTTGNNGKPDLDAGLKVGIPGKYTTANFLLGLAYPQLQRKEELVFSGIEQAVLDGRTDLGLLIHENRFTYQEKGLHKILDLGDFWEKETGFPIPLGGIAIHRRLPLEIQQKVNRLIRKSVEFAFENPTAGLDFIRSHAQAMSTAVMYKHIDLYVNSFSINLGARGRLAVETLISKAVELNLVPPVSKPLFMD